MEHVWVHEYFRIFFPGIFLVGVLKLLFPAQLSSDMGQFLLLSAFVGLVSTPFSDKLAKKYFHRQIIKTKFYERFISAFLKFHNKSPLTRLKERKVKINNVLSLQSVSR
jgi:hypothetical protein